MQGLRKAIFFMLVNFLSSATLAEGIEIHESDTFDFNGCQLYDLAPGINVLSGTATSQDTNDGFRFVVPAGYTAKVNVEYQISQSEGTALVWELQSLLTAESCEPIHENSFLQDLGVDLLASEILQYPADFKTPSPWDFTPVQGIELGEGVYTLYNNWSFGLVDKALFEYTFSIEVVGNESATAGGIGPIFLLLVTALFSLLIFNRRTGGRAN